MSRNWLLYLEDMENSAAKILEYTDGLEQDSFLNNSLIYDATLRNLEILGEAAKYIPESIRAAHPDVEWQKIREFRNFVTHAYFKVDPDILWDVITRKVPELQEKLAKCRS